MSRYCRDTRTCPSTECTPPRPPTRPRHPPTLRDSVEPVDVAIRPSGSATGSRDDHVVADLLDQWRGLGHQTVRQPSAFLKDRFTTVQPTHQVILGLRGGDQLPRRSELIPLGSASSPVVAIALQVLDVGVRRDPPTSLTVLIRLADRFDLDAVRRAAAGRGNTHDVGVVG